MATIKISLDDYVARINPNIYGHFAEHLGHCIYEGIWVGEDSPIPNTNGIRNDVVEAMKRLKPPVIRWPGGCFADDYHWEDGIGPREDRPRTVNAHWGQVIETNEFGSHEFVEFCRLVGADPYVCGNVGSGTPREMRDWVEYCNYPGDSARARQRAANGHPEPFRVKFWGVGNENWGCGGQFDPEDYAVEYRRFSTFLFNFQDAPLYLIACGPSGNNAHWTRKFFEKLGRRRINGFAAHYYCGTAGTATEYTVDQWYQLIHNANRMEELVVQQRAIMDGFDPDRNIGLIIDEWGTWHPPTPGRERSFLWQQNTIRDGLVAALSLDIFNRHADKVVMGNIAQTINVLQAMILTEGEKMLVTPTGHVYAMYTPHQGARALRTSFEANSVSFKAGNGNDESLFGLAGSASLKGDTLFLTVVNPHVDTPVEATIQLRGGGEARSATASVLTHDDIHAHNTFHAPETVAPAEETLSVSGAAFQHTFPAASVTALSISLA